MNNSLPSVVEGTEKSLISTDLGPFPFCECASKTGWAPLRPPRLNHSFITKAIIYSIRYYHMVHHPNIKYLRCLFQLFR